MALMALSVDTVSLIDLYATRRMRSSAWRRCILAIRLLFSRLNSPLSTSCLYRMCSRWSALARAIAADAVSWMCATLEIRYARTCSSRLFQPAAVPRVVSGQGQLFVAFRAMSFRHSPYTWPTSMSIKSQQTAAISSRSSLLGATARYF